MFGPSFKASKCKTQLKLCVSRVKLLRNKREMTVKQMKKEIAELLKEGKEPSATIRVEHILREEATMAAYDVVELFCELLCVRLPIIEANKECPFDLKEAIASIIFAAPRCADLPELQQLRILFAAKYGKEFAAAAAELRPDSGVNRRIIEKLAIKSPSGEVKLQMLKDIAAEHNFDWDSTASEKILMEPKQDLLDGPLSKPSAQAQPATPQPIPAKTTPPQTTAPTLIREDSAIPPHLMPGAHDNNAPEQFQAPPSPDTPTYAINHPTGQDAFAGNSYSVPNTRVSPLGPTVTGAPARTPSMDDEELFAPATVTPQPEVRSGRAPGGREEYADVAAAAAAAAESADRAAAAARAAARLAGSQAREGGYVKRDEPRRGEGNEYRSGGLERGEEEEYSRKREHFESDDEERRFYEGEKQEKGKRRPNGERDPPAVAKPPRGHLGGGDSFRGVSEDRSKNQYQRETEYRSETQYKSENQYRGEASGKSGALLKKSPSDDLFSEPRSDSGNGSEGSLGGGRSQRKPPKSVRRYDESEDGFDDEAAEKRRAFAESRQFGSSSGRRSSGRGDDVFERQTSSKSNDSVARKFEEFEARGRGEDGYADSGEELEGYDDEDIDLDLPMVPKHDPRRSDSFKEAPSPFDEAPDVPRPEKGSYIPAGKDGFIFFHDEKRNVTLDEVPPPDTFDRVGRTVLPPPPGHPNRDRVIKATTPKRGNSPENSPRGGPSDFDDRIELPSAPPVPEMDEMTARFEALKARH